MAGNLRLLALLVVCLGVALALRPSTRRPVEPFQEEIPRVHLIQFKGARVSPLSFEPTVQTEDSHAIAIDLAEQALGFSATYKVKNSYISKLKGSQVIRHVYLRQTAADGREIFNADLNINVFNKKATNVGHSFFNGSVAPVAGSLTSTDALKALLAFLRYDVRQSSIHVEKVMEGIDRTHTLAGVKGAVSPVKARAGYVIRANGKGLEPVWDFELDMDLSYWNAQVSMRDGRVLVLFDWVSDLNTYNIYPWGVNDPSDGDRVIESNPATTASPLGWHSQGNGTYYNTVSNNVYAQNNPSGGTNYLYNQRPENAGLDFNYPINFAQQPATYVNASTTNLFAWNNYIHDVWYRWGFDEPAGNFQENNWGLGGLGGDSVVAFCQDGGGTNNANFLTPPDGQRGRMRMYIWTQSNPYRDGDLESGIIIHEYAHGLSNRLTGGPANVNCLQTAEAGGMGEGWGDFIATAWRQRASYKDSDAFPMGAYSYNNPRGIRNYPYSTDFKIDPETYVYVNNGNYSGVHAKGEVWAGILWQVYWNFVNTQGFTPNLDDGIAGNTNILRLVVLGLKIQPCNPNFVDARNAILSADETLNGGQNACLLWTAFAKRGLGVNAVPGAPRVKEDFTVPAVCL